MAKELKTQNAKLKTQNSKTVKTAKSSVVVKKSSSIVSAKEAKVSLPVFGLDGAKKGTVVVPGEMFGAKVNDKLMAQAVRVYLVNQRQGTASTKTRGEVNMTTAKWYRQKGTGRARHGAKSAPIFVGGGVAFGPRPRNFELKLSKQMRKKALFSALSKRLTDERVLAVDIDSASGKTKEIFKMLKSMKLVNNKKATKILFALSGSEGKRAARNIDGVSILPPALINTYQVLNSNYVIFAKSAIPELEKTFLTKGKAASA